MQETTDTSDNTFSIGAGFSPRYLGFNPRWFHLRFLTNEVIFFGATTPVWALAYLHETLRFTSVF
jgi:hypothetical protein